VTGEESLKTAHPPSRPAAEQVGRSETLTVTDVPETSTPPVCRLIVRVPVGLAAREASFTPMASIWIAPGVKVLDREEAPDEVGQAAFALSLFE
jgi:hypothetical protein